MDCIKQAYKTEATNPNVKKYTGKLRSFKPAIKKFKHSKSAKTTLTKLQKLQTTINN